MQTVELPFTTLEIHDFYVIGRTKEGVNLCIDDHLQVIDTVNQYLTPPYAFIVDEVNSYSIDFPVMQHIRNDMNISCIGVVYYREATRKSLEVGTMEINKPVFFSNDLNTVTNWVEKKIAF